MWFRTNLPPPPKKDSNDFITWPPPWSGCTLSLGGPPVGGKTQRCPKGERKTACKARKQGLITRLQISIPLARQSLMPKKCIAANWERMRDRELTRVIYYHSQATPRNQHSKLTRLKHMKSIEILKLVSKCRVPNVPTQLLKQARASEWPFTPAGLKFVHIVWQRGQHPSPGTYSWLEHWPHTASWEL